VIYYLGHIDDGICKITSPVNCMVYYLCDILSQAHWLAEIVYQYRWSNLTNTVINVPEIVYHRDNRPYKIQVKSSYKYHHQCAREMTVFVRLLHLYFVWSIIYVIYYLWHIDDGICKMTSPVLIYYLGHIDDGICKITLTNTVINVPEIVYHIDNRPYKIQVK
jgi:hypothetical protein